MSQDIYVLIEHLRGQVADVSYVMLVAARELTQGSDGQVIAVLLGHKAQGLAQDLSADQVLYLDHPILADFTSDAYAKVLSALITERQPRAVLFGSTSIGADIASTLSARLGLPLVSSCRAFTSGGRFVSQICGGKIMAEGELPAPTALATMIPGGYKADNGRSTKSPVLTPVEVAAIAPSRVTLSKYLEPDAGDVDIAKEPLLIAVGRGIQNQDNISLAEDLAKAMGGVVCGSRPVIDQGWLAATRLVGKSGKHVKPKVYLALGISGAPEHVEAITDSDTIIAINTDPTAPIFNIAKYGAEVDIFDLIPALTERAGLAKG